MKSGRRSPNGSIEGRGEKRLKRRKKGKNKTRVASQKRERTNTKERGEKEKRMEWKKLNVKGVKKFQRQSID